MRISSIGTMLSSMYTDLLTVTRKGKKTNPDGTTGTDTNPTTVFTDKPCRISFEREDNSGSTKEDTNPKQLQVKVFCDANLLIKKGDTIIAKRVGDGGVVLATYKGLAGLPCKFITHQEVIMNEVGDA